MQCTVMQKNILDSKKQCYHKAQNHIEKLSATNNTFPPRKKGKFAKTQAIPASVQ